ncbi:unnamed protein product [Medioppia subpectinata]|uniref:Malonyl-CoA:ACP transacylase (MAT) domain-containing protein n=1 Tax=Medioppia subpectinata TaxID=1979941 RepID=A0A7R9Q034_9ACAR|nr:unnamed protein product [Medioppia subpectinata]CAG2106810.1 unnamed protein product [Medioppia subpectinata]
MSVRAFRESWLESAKIVAPLGVNLMDCINGYRFKFGDKPFAGVGGIQCLAYQFAIVDTLRALGITPDGYFGHSLGEVMCAYMDGWADRRQCLLAYSAAQLRATDEYNHGLLLQAATDCTWSELTTRRTHVTGYEAPVRALIDELNEQGRITKPLWLAPYSIHTGSAFMADTYDTLRKQFERVVPDPQRRQHSARWLTSVPPPMTGGPSLSSPPEYTFAEFMASMLWSPVDVKSAVDRLPADALVIDISGQRDLRHVVLKDRPQAKYISCTRVEPTIANQSVITNVRQLLANTGTDGGPTHVIATTRQATNAALDELRDRHSNLHVLQLDGTDYKSFDGFAKQVADIVGDRGLDTLINNAGIYLKQRLNETTAEDMVTNFKVNSVGPLMLTRALLPVLKKSAAAKRKTIIVNITSQLGSIQNIDKFKMAMFYPYIVSKAALNMINKCLDVDLASYGIRSVAIHPGHVATDMSPHGTFTPEQSVTQVLRTANTVKDSDYGKMLNYDGAVLPF